MRSTVDGPQVTSGTRGRRRATRRTLGWTIPRSDPKTGVIVIDAGARDCGKVGPLAGAPVDARGGGGRIRGNDEGGQREHRGEDRHEDDHDREEVLLHARDGARRGPISDGRSNDHLTYSLRSYSM